MSGKYEQRAFELEELSKLTYRHNSFRGATIDGRRVPNLASHRGFRFCDFTDTKVIEWEGAHVTWEHCYFGSAYLLQCVLRKSTVSNSTFDSADFDNCEFLGGNFWNVTFRHCTFRNCTFNEGTFSGCAFRSCSFVRCTFIDINAKQSVFPECVFRNCSGLPEYIRPISVEHGNVYWKAISWNLCNSGYTYTVGLNKLPDGEVFADSPAETCGYPGFHFAGYEWVLRNYGDRHFLCKVRIPEDASICVPYGTDGKASADSLIIEKVYNMPEKPDRILREEDDVTYKFIGHANGFGEQLF
jgi:hypothetical protein